MREKFETGGSQRNCEGWKNVHLMGQVNFGHKTKVCGETKIGFNPMTDNMRDGSK